MRRASVAREREQMEEEKAEFPLGGKSTLESVGRKKKEKKSKKRHAPGSEGRRGVMKLETGDGWSKLV